MIFSPQAISPLTLIIISAPEYCNIYPAEKLAEGLEEIVSDVLNPVAEYIVTGNYDPATIDQLVEDGAVGVLTALIAGGGQDIASRVVNGSPSSVKLAEAQHSTDAQSGAANKPLKRKTPYRVK